MDVGKWKNIAAIIFYSLAALKTAIEVKKLLKKKKKRPQKKRRR
ncbi:hypothetical protein [Paenibacillus sp. GbtcB18]|nr:hypothetical protein [Paenibacillus sp. GbtcB18]